MDKSNKLIYFSILALVFVIFYFMTGSEDAVSNTLQSVVLVGIATIITWVVIREQQKQGRLKTI